jgi:predicted PurR-regulated permease PerM
MKEDVMILNEPTKKEQISIDEELTRMGDELIELCQQETQKSTEICQYYIVKLEKLIDERQQQKLHILNQESQILYLQKDIHNTNQQKSQASKKLYWLLAASVQTILTCILVLSMSTLYSFKDSPPVARMLISFMAGVSAVASFEAVRRSFD